MTFTPGFKSEEDEENERLIQAAAEQWSGAKCLIIGTDKKEDYSPRIDRCFYRGERVVAFAEFKGCHAYAFGEGEEGGYTTGEKKVLVAKALREIMRVPVLYFVRFSLCGTIARFDPCEPYERKDPWGRKDRGYKGDVEPGARFAWELLHPLPKPKEQAA